MSLVNMKIMGFTGTQEGMEKPQFRSFCLVYEKFNPQEFHSGDCIGSDEEAHNVAVIHGAKTIIHPPDDSSKRAFCKGDVIKIPKPYLERNNDIVTDVEYMVATPKECIEVRRSGTWATIRYTRKAHKKIFIIFPDGSMVYEVTLCSVCGLPRRYCVCDDMILRIDNKTGEREPCPQGSVFSPGKREIRKIEIEEIGRLMS